MADTFVWFGTSGLSSVVTNWTPEGPPLTGDAAIENGGTIQLADSELLSNSVFNGYGIQQIGGEIEVTSGNTLAATFPRPTRGPQSRPARLHPVSHRRRVRTANAHVSLAERKTAA